MNSEAEGNHFDLSESLTALETTPKTFRAMIASLPEAWTEYNEEEGAWSPRSVIIHLIHTEQDNWMIRTRVLISDSEDKAFPPFNQMPEESELPSGDLMQLLDQFARIRAENLAEVRALDISQEDLDREAVHPSLGTVNLKQLISTWVVHDFNHLHQIAKTLAKYYGSEVGPWRKHLAILDL